MKPDILKKWVTALRSGKYKQGKEKLKTLNGIPKFCCLGVLCDLHAKATKGKWRDEKYEEAGYYYDMYGELPMRVMKWADLEDADPILDAVGNKSASRLNDRGSTFKAIARLIEQAQNKKLI